MFLLSKVTLSKYECLVTWFSEVNLEKNTHIRTKSQITIRISSSHTTSYLP